MSLSLQNTISSSSLQKIPTSLFRHTESSETTEDQSGLYLSEEQSGLLRGCPTASTRISACKSTWIIGYETAASHFLSREIRALLFDSN